MIDAVESWMSAWWGWGPKTDPAFSRLLRLAELEASQRSKARYMARCIAAHELLVSSKPSSNEAMPSGAVAPPPWPFTGPAAEAATVLLGGSGQKF